MVSKYQFRLINGKEFPGGKIRGPLYTWIWSPLSQVTLIVGCKRAGALSVPLKPTQWLSWQGRRMLY